MDDLREHVLNKLELLGAYADNNDVDELITLIRNATLDEVRPEVERLLTDEVVIANCINFETLNKAINNLRGK